MREWDGIGGTGTGAGAKRGEGGNRKGKRRIRSWKSCAPLSQIPESPPPRDHYVGIKNRM